MIYKVCYGCSYSTILADGKQGCVKQYTPCSCECNDLLDKYDWQDEICGDMDDDYDEESICPVCQQDYTGEVCPNCGED